MTKVKFLRDSLNDGGGHPSEAQSFSAGEVYELPDASANFWIVRKRAVLVVGETNELVKTVTSADIGEMPFVSQDADPIVTEEVFDDTADKSIDSPPADKMLKKTRGKKSAE